MSLIVRKPEGSSDIELITAGMHEAICIRIYDTGSHYSEMYDKTSKKVIVCWEIPDQRINWEGEDQPRMTSREYTQSLHKKATLRIDLESWRSKEFTEKELEGFDLQNILGKSCTLQIIHKTKDDRTFANIHNVLPATKQLNPQGQTVFFSLSSGEPIPKGTPDWIREKIESCEEWGTSEEPLQEPQEPRDGEYPPDDDIPF